MRKSFADWGRAQSHESWRLEISLTIQTNRDSLTSQGTRKASKMMDNTKRLIEEQVNNDEATEYELQKLLPQNDITVCASIALRWRQQLGWTSKGTSYCQMIREVNKEKRLAWAIKNKDMFWEDVIYTDETTVQIENHWRILERCLVPFLRAVYPDGHRFVQDNDPKHCSNYARRFYENRGIDWWPTPPELPDLNPIKHLWHELKEFI